MAAYEDFEFFRTAGAGASVAAAPRPVRDSARAAGPRAPGSRSGHGDRDALRAELERLHLEVTRLRAKVRGRGLGAQIRRLMARFVSRDLHRIVDPS
jgi:hypothetical protein